MKILLDGMGGDFAPDEVVKGAIKAAADINETIAILGPEDKLKESLEANKWSGDNIEIINATEVITNDEKPAMAIRKKKDSTIVKGMEMLKHNEADIFISGGSTGALLAGGLTILGRIKGIKRPAIAAWFPRAGKKGVTLLLDCGASVEAKPEYLLQYGIMGDIFVRGITGKISPSVRLLNVGTEEGKGDDLRKEAYGLLKNSYLNFLGNVEARDVVYGESDIVVMDGFSGNIYLKASEGMASALMGLFKNKLTEGIRAKVGAMLAYSKIKDIKNTFDYSDAGGAPILGLKGAVLKVHGNSRSVEFYYAIHRAVDYVNSDITGKITDAIEKNGSNKTEEAESESND